MVEAFERGLRVVHGAGVIAETVAESTLLAMLLALHNVMEMDTAMKRGVRQPRKHGTSGDLVGRTVGLIGLGYVGRRVIPRLRPFGVHLLVYDPYVTAQEAAGSPRRQERWSLRRCSLSVTSFLCTHRFCPPRWA